MEITVVGAGAIGLCTAVTLQERGHRVRVVAAARGEATTSSVAAALWFPYRCGPRDKVTAWAARTRSWLEALGPDAGVDIQTCYEIAVEDERPWWADIVGAELSVAPVAGSPPAWSYRAPRADSSIFLAYLEARVSIEARTVTDLAAEPGDVVVNCTGLASRELARDERLEPLLGQVVIADRGDADPNTTITDERDPDAMFYIIPRRDSVVLGGCSLPYPHATPPIANPEITARILGQARVLGIHVGTVRGERVGLRPYRDEVRLERVGRVIHNYGHGGAGFTLCRGCAEDVALLL